MLEQGRAELIAGGQKRTESYSAALVAGICVFGLVYHQTGRQLLPPLLLAVEKEFGLTHLKGSALVTAFSLVYAVMQAMVGVVNHAVGRRRTLILSTLSYAAVLAATSMVRGYVSLLVLQVMAALTAGTYFVTGLSTVAAASESSRYRGLLVGLYLAGGSLGAVVSSAVASSALKFGSWRVSYGAWGVIGALVGVALLRWLPEPHVRSTPEGPAKGLHTGFGKWLARPVYVLLVVGLLFNSTKTWGLNTFMCAFLAEMRGFTQASAAALFGQMRAMGAFGQVTAGVLTDSFGKLETVILATGLGALLSGFLLFPSTHAVVLAILALYGFLGAMAYGAILSAIHQITPAENRDTATGIANGVSFVGAAVGPIMVGRLIDTMGFGRAFLAATAVGGLGCAMACLTWLCAPSLRRSRRRGVAPNRASA